MFFTATVCILLWYYNTCIQFLQYYHHYFIIIASYAWIIIDIDECSTGTPCDTNAACTDTDGSYDCTCNSGYEGNGVTCSGRSRSSFYL